MPAPLLMPRASQAPKILAADDDETVRRLLGMHLSKGGFNAEIVEDGAEVLAAVDPSFDAVLLDLNMPHVDGFECLREIRKKYPRLSVVMLSSEGEAKHAVTAMKEGALDYLTKPFDPEEVLAVLRNAVEHSRLSKENETLKDAVGSSLQQREFVAEAPAMKELLEKISQLASLDMTVLLTGESGVGKSLLARHLHGESKRADSPFVSVSCPALPRELLESELFGHEKGAFTGAVKRHVGKIEAASGGTLFLDEVGDLPLELQPKFLNVLQDRQFSRIGSTKTLDADIRLVAATNIDLQSRVAEKEFREDLYYRLHVVPLEIPALRDRREDIIPLAQHILERIAATNGARPLELNSETEALLREQSWPGNVRQLENVLERAFAFSPGGSLGSEELKRVLDRDRLPAAAAPGPESGGSGKPAAPALAGRTLQEIERDAIIQTLESTGHNKAKTARRLGISEKSVYNKMKRLGIS